MRLYIRLQLLVALLLAGVLVTSPTLALFKDPHVSGASPSKQVNISVDAINPEDPYVRYRKSHEKGWREAPLESGIAHLNATYVDAETSYEYFFVDDELRFPTRGSFHFSLSHADPIISNATKDMLGNDAEKYCYPQSGDFSCNYEDFQAAEILRFAKATSHFDNESYEQTLLNLTAYPITDVQPDNYIEDGHCDHTYADFNCETNVGDPQHVVAGGVKQGLMIHSMWNAYAATHNETIKQRAINYTRGHASDCDVWNEDFRCDNAESQGAMTIAYLEAYRRTGNTTYYTIAEKLSERSPGAHPLKAAADWKTYRLTANETLRTRAKEETSSLIGNCTQSNCSQTQRAFHLLLYTEAYKTLRTDTYREALQNLLEADAADCAPLQGSLTCEIPKAQGLMNYALLQARLALTGHPTFVEPRVHNATYGENMSISADRYGYLPEPTLLYKHEREKGWHSTPLNADLKATIDTDTLGEGVVQFFFNSSRGSRNRFPRQNALRLVLPRPFERFRSKAQLLSTKDPLHFCDPFGSRERYANFSCKEEDMQGWMILSRAMAASFHNDSAVRSQLRDQMREFSEAYIDQNDFSRSTCEFKDDDYRCEDISDFLAIDNYQEPGAVRQAMMIMGMLSLYSSPSGNETHKHIALNYLSHPSESCAPIHGDFDCGSPRTQGYISLAYWRATEALGRHRHYDIAQELTDRLEGANASPIAALALWRGYALSGSESYRSAARAMMSEMSQECVENTCEPAAFARQNLLYWEAYRISGNVSYAYDAYLKATSQTGGDMEDCHPNSPSYDPGDPQTEDVFECKTPDTQGMMTSSFIKARQNYFLARNHSFSINMSPLSNVSFGSHHKLNCTFNNTGNSTVKNVYLTLNTLQAINATEVINATGTTVDVFAQGDRIRYDTVDPGESFTVSWTLNATYGGKQTIGCWVEENSAQRDHIVTDIPAALEMHTESPSYWPDSSSFTKSYSLDNLHDFKLSDVALRIDTPRNLTVDEVRTPERTVEDNTLQVPLLYENLSFNVSYTPRDDLVGNSTLTTDFAYSEQPINFTQLFIIYSDFIDLGLTYPERVSMYDDFALNLLLNYTQDFTANNLTITSRTPESLRFQNVSTNLTGPLDANATSLTLSELNRTAGYASWRFYANSSLNVSVLFNASAPKYHYYEELPAARIDILPRAFILNATYPGTKAPYGEAFAFNLTLLSRGNVSHDLTNVTITPRVSDGLTIIEKTSRFAFTYQTTEYPSNMNMDGQVSVFESADNDSLSLNTTKTLALNFTNISYNDSLLESMNLRLRHRAPNETRLNISYVNDSSRLEACSIVSTDNWGVDLCNVTQFIPGGSVNNETFEFHLQADSNLSLDRVMLNLTSVNETAQGGNVTPGGFRFGQLNPYEKIFTRWTFLINSTADNERATYELYSEEGTFDTLDIEFPVESPPSTETQSSSSSGGGGIGAGPITSEREFPTTSRYAYEEYNISAYLPSRDELQEFLPYSDEGGLHDSLYNHSVTMARCMNISRTYQEPPNQDITLNVSYGCDKTSYFVLFYEQIQGNVNQSVDYPNATNISESLFLSRRESVFHAGHLGKNHSFTIHYVLSNTTENSSAPYDLDYIRPLVFGYPSKEMAYRVARQDDLEFIRDHIPPPDEDAPVDNETEPVPNGSLPPGGGSNDSTTPQEDNGTTSPYGGGEGSQGNATITFEQLKERVIGAYHQWWGYALSLLILGALVSLIVYMHRVHAVEHGLNNVQRGLFKMLASASKAYARLHAESVYLYHVLRRVIREMFMPIRFRMHASYKPKRKQAQSMKERFLTFHEKKLEADRRNVVNALAQEDLHTAYKRTNAMKRRLEKIAPYYNSDSLEARYAVLRQQFSFALMLYKYVYYTVSIRRFSRDIMKNITSGNAQGLNEGLQHQQKNFERQRAALYKQLRRFKWFSQFRRMRSSSKQQKTLPRYSLSSYLGELRGSLHLWFSRLFKKDPYVQLDAEFYYLLNELRHHLEQEDMDNAKETYRALEQVRRKIQQSFQWRARDAKHNALLELYKRLIREMKEKDQEQQNSATG